MQQSVILDFVTFKLEVTGYYTPEEKEVRYYKDGSGHPGYPSEFEIEKVNLVEGDITELISVMACHEDEQIAKLRKKSETWNVENFWNYLVELSIKKIENEYLQH